MINKVCVGRVCTYNQSRFTISAILKPIMGRPEMVVLRGVDVDNEGNTLRVPIHIFKRDAFNLNLTPSKMVNI